MSGLTVFTKLQVVTRTVPKDELKRQGADIKEKYGSVDIDALEDDLLQRAFPKTTHHLVWFDTRESTLYIEAGSYKQAEAVATEIRKVLGSLPIETMPLTAIRLTTWLDTKETLPDGLTVTEECELIDSEKQKATFSKHDLYDETVLNHIADGKDCTKLGLNFEDKMTFVLTSDMQIKKLKLSVEPDGEVKDEDDLAASQLVLLSSEVREMMNALTG